MAANEAAATHLATQSRYAPTDHQTAFNFHSLVQLPEALAPEPDFPHSVLHFRTEFDPFAPERLAHMPRLPREVKLSPCWTFRTSSTGLNSTFGSCSGWRSALVRYRLTGTFSSNASCGRPQL